MENFELPIGGQPAVLLIGRNGSGKSTLALALEVLQKIARGTNRVANLVTEKDIARGQRGPPVRFEIEVQIGDAIYEYKIAFELPETLKELRVLEERFVWNGSPVYTREHAQVSLLRNTRGQQETAAFRIDWHVAALPIVQEQSKADPVFTFKHWRSRSLILRPVPALKGGESDQETLELNSRGTNFGACFTGILGLAPRAYSQIDKYARQVMPDFQEIRNPIIGKDSRSLEVSFEKDRTNITIPFDELSDGEKCFMI